MRGVGNSCCQFEQEHHPAVEAWQEAGNSGFQKGRNVGPTVSKICRRIIRRGMGEARSGVGQLFSRRAQAPEGLRLACIADVRPLHRRPGGERRRRRRRGTRPWTARCLGPAWQRAPPLVPECWAHPRQLRRPATASPRRAPLVPPWRRCSPRWDSWLFEWSSAMAGGQHRSCRMSGREPGPDGGRQATRRCRDLDPSCRPASCRRCFRPFALLDTTSRHWRHSDLPLVGSALAPVTELSTRALRLSRLVTPCTVSLQLACGVPPAPCKRSRARHSLHKRHTRPPSSLPPPPTARAKTS